jgi:hypothetical protein
LEVFIMMSNARGKKRGRRSNRGFIDRKLRDMSTVVRFRIVDNNVSPAQLSASGSGVLAGYQNADPSGGSGATWTASEWSTITALYSEVRLVEFTVNFMPVPPQDNKVSGDIANYLTTSTVLNSLSSAPTSSSQVYDNADGKIHCFLTTRSPKPIKVTLRPKGPLNWAVVTSPNPGSYAGCPGAIQWYTDSQVVSVVYFLIKMEGIYEFRSRI